MSVIIRVVMFGRYNCRIEILKLNSLIFSAGGVEIKGWKEFEVAVIISGVLVCFLSGSRCQDILTSPAKRRDTQGLRPEVPETWGSKKSREILGDYSRRDWKAKDSDFMR